MAQQSDGEKIAVLESKIKTSEGYQVKIFEGIDKLAQKVEKILIIEERQVEMSSAVTRLSSRIDNLGEENRKLTERVQHAEQEVKTGKVFRSRVYHWAERGIAALLVAYLGWDKL